MYIYVLDNLLNRIGLIDNYVSLIWTTRYYECGDFELYVPATNDFIELLQIGRYLETTESEYVMIIESINIKTDVENGDYMTVSGRSVESLLDRRIMYPRMTYNSQLVAAMQGFVTYNFIRTTDERKVDNIVIGESEVSTSNTVNSQFLGQNVYELESEYAKMYGLGFKMPLIDGKFTFIIYKGKDRTISQKENEPAIFSPEFENLVNTEYSYSEEQYKNSAIVAGEGEGYDRKIISTLAAGIANPTGINRREIFVDARDLTSKNEDESEIDSVIYGGMLAMRGKEKLSELQTFPEYVGETTAFPEYCGLGDIVEVKNEFGMTATARITEIIESYSVDGITKVPTLDEWSV